MTKKNKKADAVLAAARNYCEFIEQLSSISEVEKPKAKVENKPAKVEAKPIKPVLPKNITLFDEITIVKKGKGDYRAEVKVNGQKYYLINRFKSITKANEWKAVHLKV